MNYKIAVNNEEWHDLRSNGLGGSDIGTMLGLNQNKSPYQLWLEKTGQIEAPDISSKLQVQIGNELEDFVARLFEQESGMKVQRDNKTHYHKEHPFLLANIDRKIVGEKALLECKTTGAFSANQWDEDEIPASYIMQVQHYLNVLDYEYAYIAVVIGNHDFKFKKIERDQELIDMYIKEAIKFWNENVLKNVAPEIDGSPATKEALNLVDYEPLNSLAILSSQKEKLVELGNVKAQIKELTQYQTEIENKLKNYMYENEADELLSDEFKVTWKETKRTSIDTKALKKEMPDVYEQYSKETTYKRFTVKEIN
ncbi:YqaJ viral recombinase family nuclease [Globicatella sanguinis]|uniref:YqaJ viral recombinase family nuclease n=1 Tax=Globicatella sanguinis TaxID=13076 RepID=UPI000824042C|nr:YqaJ viral recombinase family protein [Globicatella sanguinis]